MIIDAYNNLISRNQYKYSSISHNHFYYYCHFPNLSCAAQHVWDLALTKYFFSVYLCYPCPCFVHLNVHDAMMYRKLEDWLHFSNWWWKDMHRWPRTTSCFCTCKYNALGKKFLTFVLYAYKFWYLTLAGKKIFLLLNSEHMIMHSNGPIIRKFLKYWTYYPR